ncbi:META domain-containing protein [Streptomyces pactum]|uniref:META domain-containing protein n=1 Tax=Streptomyces pactum TaxID=68249 RepID=A0ABS0NTZ8_9ACTN|nr:META domain-containing protein [Streptomyces pactum]MBH5338683.1 META domain-containing protein [Streptomyces pactum]
MKRHTKATYTAAAVVCGAVLAACGSGSDDTETVGSDVQVTGVRWVPRSVTVDGATHRRPSDAEAHITFDLTEKKGPGGGSGGSPGCNHLGADVDVDGDTVNIRDTALTAMACTGERQRFEDRFMKVFTGKLTAKVSGGGERLTLSKDNGDRIEFDAREEKPAEPLKGTRWTVTGFSEGQTTRSLPAGTAGRAHFTLDRDGQVTGSLGCNTFSADAVVEGGRIEFGPLASTRKACPGPATEVENRVREVLTDGPVRYRQDDGGLLLTAASGKGVTATAK